MHQFQNVTAEPLANLYHGNNVVSHGITLPDGSKKTFGVIFPGSYRFNTVSPEHMQIIDGSCEVVIDGSDTTKFIPTDEAFEVSGNSGFCITVHTGICQYICSFL